MVTRQELENDVSALGNALRDADAAGDTANATRYARAYRKAKSRLDQMVSNPGEYDPESPEYREKYGAADSFLQNLRAGVGKTFDDLWLGMNQRASDVANLFPATPMSTGSRIAKDRLQEQARDRRELNADLMDTKAGVGGNIAGHIAAFMLPGSQATTLPRALTLGAAEGALVPTESDSDLAVNVGTGAAFGGIGHGIARGVGRLAQPTRNANSARAQDAVDLLRREGVSLDVAQRTGSPGAQRVRSALGDNPLTVGRQQEFTDTQLRQYTRAVLRRIGADADEATPDVLRNATREIGRQIDDALASAPPVFDTVLASDIRRIQAAIPRTLTDDVARPLLKSIQDVFNSVDVTTGVMSPAKFQQIRSALSKLRRSTPAAGELAGDLEDALLNALQRAGGDRAGLARALAHWRNFRIIENSIDKGVDKTISPLRLSNTMSQIRNRAASLRDMGHPETIELARLAEAGRELLPETLGNSGTFGRMLVGQGILGAGAGGGALLAGEDPGDALMIGAGAASLPYLIQRGMLSQGRTGNYLTQGIGGPLQDIGTSPITEALIRQTAISGGLLGQ